MTTRLRELLPVAQRAPSAHNAQPWRLSRGEDGWFTLSLAAEDALEVDAGNRDGILAAGAYCESLSLGAQLQGQRMDFVAHAGEPADHLQLGRLRFLDMPSGAAPDRLAGFLQRRQTNRGSYLTGALPAELENRLKSLGVVLVAPDDVAPLVERATTLAWQDPVYVAEMRRWTRSRAGAPDGITTDALDLSGLQPALAWWGLRRGGLSPRLAALFARGDAARVRQSSVVAVMGVDYYSPADLVEAGRIALRAWLTITGAGFAYQPLSVLLDQATVADVATLAGVSKPAAVFRIGRPLRTPAWSRRRDPFKDERAGRALLQLEERDQEEPAR